MGDSCAISICGWAISSVCACEPQKRAHGHEAQIRSTATEHGHWAQLTAAVRTGGGHRARGCSATCLCSHRSAKCSWARCHGVAAARAHPHQPRERLAHCVVVRRRVHMQRHI